ncbi:hypothetical protein COO60DRAFT_994217 [Scenedesmus sp. NREL 46B-D3]|nr:hypothetical protein COO60DRAFT_994217 [Scenedesmus sp. NREL 46B-D3]
MMTRRSTQRPATRPCAATLPRTSGPGLVMCASLHASGRGEGVSRTHARQHASDHAVACASYQQLKGLPSSTSALATLAPVPAITWALCDVCGASPFQDKVSVKLKHVPAQGAACHVADTSASRLWRSGACCSSLQRCMAFRFYAARAAEPFTLHTAAVLHCVWHTNVLL